jgi:hypothetical protein
LRRAGSTLLRQRIDAIGELLTNLPVALARLA